MTRVAIYGFMSVKGGVGKTTLAIAAAADLAAAGRPVAVIDADFSGTSIADGLALLAPDVVDGDRIRWHGLARGHLQREEYDARRRQRVFDGRPAGLAFFDDLLFGRAERFDANALAWRHPDVPKVLWFPSSPAPKDVYRAIRTVFAGSPDRLMTRLRTVVERIAEALGPGGTVLVDLPPAMYGVPTALSRTFAQPGDRVERLIPVLVTTQDRNDLRRATDEYLRLFQSFPRMKWILNRNTKAPEVVRREILDHLGPKWATIGVEQDLDAVGHLPDSLGRLFVSERLTTATDGLVLRLLERR